MQSHLDMRQKPLKVFVRDKPAPLSRSCAQAAALRVAVQLLVYPLLLLPEVQKYQQHLQCATQACSRGTGDLWAQNCCSD